MTKRVRKEEHKKLIKALIEREKCKGRHEQQMLRIEFEEKILKIIGVCLVALGVAILFVM